LHAGIYVKKKRHLNSFNKNIVYKAVESNSQCEVQVSCPKLIDYKNGEDTFQRIHTPYKICYKPCNSERSQTLTD